MLRKQRFLIILTILIMASLTCAMPVSTGPNFAFPVAKNQGRTISSRLTGLRQGLSTLKSYRLTFVIINNGPTPEEKNQATILVESGTDGKSSHINFQSLTSSANNSDVPGETTDQYIIGDQQCMFSSSQTDAAKSDIDPMVKEILDTWSTLIDMVPTVSEPVLIGEEDVNGVKTNHFKFKVKGLGVNSGAEVVLSDGEYWLAQDGQYIVKYAAVVETRNGPAGEANTKTLHSEFHIEVTDINQPITIDFPQTCKDSIAAVPQENKTALPQKTNTAAPQKTNTAVPQETNTAVPQEESTVTPQAGSASADNASALFEDNFSNVASGWPTYKTADASCDYSDDGFRMKVTKAAFLLWATPDQLLQNDLSLHVDATKVGGTDINSFGLVCRYQDDKNFYYLSITSDGYGGIAKRKDGQDIWLTGNDLISSAAIKQGAATNRISADCVGNTLTLYANGQQIASVTDPDLSYRGGDVGLIVGSYEMGDVDILFDNFIVFKAGN